MPSMESDWEDAEWEEDFGFANMIMNAVVHAGESHADRLWGAFLVGSLPLCEVWP